MTGRQAKLIGEAISRSVRVELRDLDEFRPSLSRWSPGIVEARIRRLAALVCRRLPEATPFGEQPPSGAQFRRPRHRSCLGLRLTAPIIGCSSPGGLLYSVMSARSFEESSCVLDSCPTREELLST